MRDLHGALKQAAEAYRQAIIAFKERKINVVMLLVLYALLTWYASGCIIAFFINRVCQIGLDTSLVALGWTTAQFLKEVKTEDEKAA